MCTYKAKNRAKAAFISKAIKESHEEVLEFYDSRRKFIVMHLSGLK